MEGEQRGEISALEVRLARLARRLRKYGLPQTLELLSGFLTLQENHVASRRIESLIHLAAVTCEGHATPTLAHLREWLNDIILRDDLAQLEDPVEDVFISNVSTWFGNARLFDGNWPDNDYYVHCCLGVLNQLSSRPWVELARSCSIALLRLSEAAVERSGTSRFALCETPPHKPIRVVSSTAARARRNVVFEFEDLRSLGIGLRTLEPFLFRLEHMAAIRAERLTNTSLERHPLLALPGEIVIAVPTAIGAAIRRFVLESARLNEDMAALEEAIAEMQFQELFHVGRVGWQIEAVKLENWAPLAKYEVIGTFDLGAYVHLIYVPDSMQETAEGGLQDTRMLAGEIEARIEARTNAISSDPSYRRGLTFVVHGGLGRGFAVGFGKAPPNWQRLALTIADFMRLGWDAEMDCLRAWKLLDQEDQLASRGIEIANMNGFVNLYAYALHCQFELVPEELNEGLIGLAIDFLTPLRHRLRTSLDQHAALAVGERAWIEVQKETTSAYFKEIEQLPIYFSPHSVVMGRLLSCVETQKRAWWVSCEEPPRVQRHRTIALQICEMTTKWLLPTARVLEDLYAGLPDGPIGLCLAFPNMEDFPERLPSGHSIECLPETRLQGQKLEIMCSAQYLLTFVHPENIGDRLMVEAIIRGVGELASVFLGEDEVFRIAQNIVGGPDARFVHMVPANTPREIVQAVVELPAPSFLCPEDRAWSRLGLAKAAGWQGGHGPIANSNACALLNDSVDVLWHRIRDKLKTLERFSVVERGLLNSYSIDFDRANWRLTAAALLALHKDTTDVIDAANSRESERGIAGLASRVLVEMAICTSPVGSGDQCAAIDFDQLISDISVLLQCSAQSDAIKFNLSDREIEVSPNGTFSFDPGYIDVLHRPYTEAHGERSFRNAAAGYAKRFSERSSGGDQSFEAFDRVFACELGVGLQALTDLALQLAIDSVEKKVPHFILRKSELCGRLAEVGSINAERAYEALTLMPRARWDEAKPKGAKPRDWYPWRYNRRLSLTRRPFVQLTNEPDPLVVASPVLLDRSVQFFCEAFEGKLPAELFDTEEMTHWIGRAVNEGGHAFNAEVAEEFSAIGYRVFPELKVTSLGGDKSLGDIDVLACDLKNGVIIVVECKRLLFARTIGEIGERLNEYTTFSESGGGRTPIQKHLDRVAFLKHATPQLAALTGVAPSRISLRSAIVTDYIVPMQFSVQALALVDTVADIALVKDAFKIGSG